MRGEVGRREVVRAVLTTGALQLLSDEDLAALEGALANELERREEGAVFRTANEEFGNAFATLLADQGLLPGLPMPSDLTHIPTMRRSPTHKRHWVSRVSSLDVVLDLDDAFELLVEGSKLVPVRRKDGIWKVAFPKSAGFCRNCM